MLGIVSYHPDVHAIGNGEDNSIVDNPAVNKSEVRDEQVNLQPEEPAINGSSKPKDGQSMNRVVESDASLVAVVKLQW